MSLLRQFKLGECLGALLLLVVTLSFHQPARGQDDPVTAQVVEEQKLLAQSALLEIVSANEKHRENRLLVVDRSAIVKVNPRPRWSGRMTNLVGRRESEAKKPRPSQIEYTYAESYLLRNAVVAHRRTLARTSVGPDSPVQISSFAWWSNRNSVVRHAGGEGNAATFTIMRDKQAGRTAEGLWRLAEAELTLGVGYINRLKRVRSFERGSDGYRIQGDLEFVPNALYAADLTLSPDLIVRRAVLTAAGPDFSRSISVETTGRAVNSQGVVMAEKGTFERVDKDLRKVPTKSKSPADSSAATVTQTAATTSGGNASVEPSGHVIPAASNSSVVADATKQPSEAGAPQAKDSTKDRITLQDTFSIQFVSISDPLSEKEYDDFTLVQPSPGAHVWDPDRLLDRGDHASDGIRSFWVWLNGAAMIVIVWLWIMKRKQSHA